MYSFKDKTVLVTGGSRGIGKAICEKFAKLGANVVINYVKSIEAANETAKQLMDSGSEVLVVQADISKFNESKNLVEKAIERFGKIDILINNSGITKDNLMLRMSEKKFDQVIDVNLKGTWNMCKHVTRHMLKNRSGKIINIASVVGIMGNAGQANYVASKAGIIGLTKTLAKEFGARGVTANAIAPGFIQTKMTDSLPDDVKENYTKQIPLQRFGTSTDIANTVLFLASDKASYITGQVISVNGGMI